LPGVEELRRAKVAERAIVGTLSREESSGELHPVGQGAGGELGQSVPVNDIHEVINAKTWLPGPGEFP
jgi:hypothetical protein